MGKIALLPEKLINQIAAGEVVERPSSVLKELIENSVDAKSTEITVELENGGKKRITVRDNGSGMEEGDIFMALERHATSKIKDGDDLFAVASMGFRGEALPSIASVSKFRISSAEEHGKGFEVQFANGRLISSGPVSIPKGTEIDVSSIFFNMPARKKFLKNDEKEFAISRELIQRFAVLYPEISFKLFHNERKILSYVPVKDKIERLASVWKTNKDKIVKKAYLDSSIKIESFIKSENSGFYGNNIFSVNGRIVSDRKVNAIIYKVQREFLGGDNNLSVALFIDIQPELVDVNVHPAKLEIRFREEKEVLEIIKNLLMELLSSIRNNDGSGMERFNYGNSERISDYGVSFVREKAPFSSQNINIPTFYPPFKEELPAKEPVPQNFTISETLDLEVKFHNYKIVGTLFSLYIILEMGNEVYFIDQHATHERIIYKALVNSMKIKSGVSQLTLHPLVVKLSLTDMLVWNENRTYFEEAGFISEQFDEETVVLRGVPAIGVELDWSLLFAEMINETAELGITSAWDDKFLSMIATMACRKAVKRNDYLTNAEIDELVKDINDSETLTCPHGRPFFVKMTKNDLEKGVNRI